ncbi:MAG TPA: hypothetical protein ENJ00_05190 [Phycisphaerales bacterium]|nr:hypothetical protein [Phycisphaerales bacterium]
MKITKRFISNLATYILGLGIGLVLVGLILQFKQYVAKNQAPPQRAPHRMVPPPGLNSPQTTSESSGSPEQRTD